MKIGIVDLDTSHPPSWMPIEREMGHEIIGVWDGGSVHPEGFDKEFIKKHNISTVFASLKDMAGEVDCAVIHGCDWDTHIEKARPFVEAGKSVFVDKPLAGNLRDLNQLVRWEKQGARITGGSSLRFCYEAREWLSCDVSERGTPHTVFCGCGTDIFNYGIHAYSMLSGIMGAGIRSVRHLGQATQRRIQINWKDGRMGIMVVGATKSRIPFYASVITEKSFFQLQGKRDIYRALLDVCLPYLSGEKDNPPVSIEELIEPELAALAAQRSWMEDDREILLSELKEDEPGYDGAAFALEYKKNKYGG
jgi:hypothetical protein